MSVLIKGMEMPTNCQHCPCVDDDSRYCKAAQKAEYERIDRIARDEGALESW